MKKILVTGASGFVGQHLVKALKQQGLFVVGVGRELLNSEADEFFSVKDFTDNGALQMPLKNCDVVVHLAARVHVMHDKVINPLEEFRKENVEGTLHLAKQAVAAGVKRFVFISSVKVNGESSEIGRPFIEADVANPQDAYGISKLEAELGLLQIAKQTGLEILIIRPPLVYGAGVKANFAIMLKMLERKIPLPLGASNNKRSFVYVGNLVSLIIKCLVHPSAKNQTFFVSDGSDLSTTELLRACATALGVRAMLIPLPKKLMEPAAAILGRQDVVQRLFGCLQVDISKARNLLGWTPPISVEEGLKITANSFNKVSK